MHAQPQCDIACLVVVSVAVAVFVVGDAAVAAVVAVVVVVCDLTAVPGRCDSCTLVLSRARTTMRWCRRMETPIGQVNKKKTIVHKRLTLPGPWLMHIVNLAVLGRLGGEVTAEKLWRLLGRLPGEDDLSNPTHLMLGWMVSGHGQHVCLSYFFLTIFFLHCIG